MKNIYLHIYFIFSFCLATSFCMAQQQWQWVTSGGSSAHTDPNDYDATWSVVSDMDGNVYASGQYFASITMGSFSANASSNTRRLAMSRKSPSEYVLPGNICFAL